jgi:putative flavoprotein involved in K+ transport
MNADRQDVIVVGGGQAGLAIGYHLARQGREFAILDAATHPAAAWRNRWDSLKLFTPVRFDSLPGLTFPGDPDAYPGRDDVAEYLTRYASEFDLRVNLDSRVDAIRRSETGYRVELAGRAYEADQVVIATGPFQVPRMPAELAAGLHSDVVQMHSSDYRRPDAMPPGPVLVVGGGNTGAQLATELAQAGHEVHLSIGTRQMPLPQRLFGRDAFRFLDATGLMMKRVDSRLGRRMSEKETLVGSGPRTLRRRYGLVLHGRTVGADGARISFEDGKSIEPSSVIWATGFDVDHSFVDVPEAFDSTGRVAHRRGVTLSPGLYFLGLQWLYTRGSALLGWVQHDAAYLAAQIAERAPAGARKPTPTVEPLNRTGAPS